MKAESVFAALRAGHWDSLAIAGFLEADHVEVVTAIRELRAAGLLRTHAAHPRSPYQSLAFVCAEAAGARPVRVILTEAGEKRLSDTGTTADPSGQ